MSGAAMAGTAADAGTSRVGEASEEVAPGTGASGAGGDALEDVAPRGRDARGGGSGRWSWSSRRRGVGTTLRLVARSDAFADLPAASPEAVAAYARATTGLDEDEAPTAATRGGGPIRAVVSWVDTLSRKEAIETARAYAETHFTATGLCSYHVERNPGTGNGWFFEVHEGGHGRAYLPNLVKALVATRRPVWFRVRNRAFSVEVTDGRPCCILQAGDMSKAWFARTGSEVGPSRTRMQPIVWKGGHVLTAGVFLALSGLAFLGLTTLIATRTVASLPTPPKVDVANLPSEQWKRFQGVPIDKYIGSVRFKDGRWQAPALKAIDGASWNAHPSVAPRRPEGSRSEAPTTGVAAPAFGPPPGPQGGAPGSQGRPPGAPAGPPTTSLPGLNDILSPSSRPDRRAGPGDRGGTPPSAGVGPGASLSRGVPDAGARGATRADAKGALGDLGLGELGVGR